MKRDAKFAIVGVSGLIAALVVTFAVPTVEIMIAKRRRAQEDQEHYERSKTECQSHLRALAEACAAYRSDHHAMPPSLQALYLGGYVGNCTLVCPEALHWRGRIDDSADYVYLPSSVQGVGTTPAEAPRPLIYDNSLEGHRGGINILLSDGSVIWDEKMEFLRQYVSAHPLTQMPLPSEKRPDPANLQEPAWLARNQETDGSWAVKRWEGTGDEGNRVGVTGLAVLAFLSNGMTEKTGDLKEHVRLATGYLTRCQQADGRIGVADPTEVLCMFNHATAGLALSEAFAMSRFRETGLAAGRALTWTQQNQHPGGGWPRSVGGAPDFDMSVLCMLQIRSGSLAGLEVDRSAMLRGRDWILKSAETSDDRGHRAAGAIVALCTTGSKKDDCAAWGEILIAEAKADDQSRAPRQLASWWESLPAFVFVRELAQAYGESDRDRIAGLRIVRLDGSPLHLSWDPSEGATPFGRAYSTAAAHLALTWYYRYLPIQK